MGGGGVIQQSSAGAAVHIFYLDRLHCTCREFIELCEKGGDTGQRQKCVDTGDKIQGNQCKG